MDRRTEIHVCVLQDLHTYLTESNQLDNFFPYKDPCVPRRIKRNLPERYWSWSIKRNPSTIARNCAFRSIQNAKVGGKKEINVQLLVDSEILSVCRPIRSTLGLLRSSFKYESTHFCIYPAPAQCSNMHIYMTQIQTGCGRTRLE